MRFSASKIKTFKACRRLYELKYIENLVPVEKPKALEVGSNYHKILEYLNSGGHIAGNPEFQGDFSKEVAMARAYENYIWPYVKVQKAEKWLEKDLGNGDVLVGIADGIAEDGRIVEHKTCGSEITEQYEYNLLWDEQILTYMYLTGQRNVLYTVCRKPNIKQKKDETDEAFFYRMLDWYDKDTDAKIRLLNIQRTDEEVAAFEDELLMMVDEIKHAGHFYKNTCYCNMYGRRCPYSSICLHYDPNQMYIEFMKGEEYESENN